jgi:hypothetical protein
MRLKDFKRPNDRSVSKLTADTLRKAKENVAAISRSLEQSDSEVEFANLGSFTEAQYDKGKGKILISEAYRGVVKEAPKLLHPLVAHERVHAEHKSDDPVDEASLQAYVDEEMAAYRAEYAAWEDVKDEYTNPQKRAQLSPESKELVARYEFKFDRIEQEGWESYRAQIEQEYRQRLERN